MGVGSISVTVPLTELKKMEEYMNEHNVSRSRLATLALQNLLNSKIKPDYSLKQQADNLKELEKQLSKSEKEQEKDIKKLEKKLSKSEKEITRLSHNRAIMARMKKQFDSERNELNKEIRKLKRQIVVIGKVTKGISVNYNVRR